MAHTLQLAMIDSLKDSGIGKILNKVQILKPNINIHNKKIKIKVSQLDCPTCWLSTLDMLERVKYLKHFIQNMAANDSSYKKV